MHAIKALREDQIGNDWRKQVLEFVGHEVWQGSDRKQQATRLWQKLDGRLEEMKERRKRLFEQKPAPNLSNDQKCAVIRGFSAL